MKRKQLLAAICVGIFLSGLTPTAGAALMGRFPTTAGGADYQAYYDDDLDITWLANANLARSNAFGVAGINGDGTMDWATAYAPNTDEAWAYSFDLGGQNPFDKNSSRLFGHDSAIDFPQTIHLSMNSLTYKNWSHKL